MEKILTFSIAAYNVEKYLDKLLKTIICVPNNEMVEVLVVNDGSKDSTAQIAKEYEKNYAGVVRLIDKENGGHGSTINRGIKEAKGKYFKAIDGDDWVDSEALEKLLNDLTQIDSDLVLMDYKTCYEGGDDVLEKTAKLEPQKTIDFESVISTIDYMRYHAVIYRTQMLQKNKIRLDEHCFYVDSGVYVVYNSIYQNYYLCAISTVLLSHWFRRAVCKCGRTQKTYYRWRSSRRKTFEVLSKAS